MLSCAIFRRAWGGDVSLRECPVSVSKEHRDGHDAAGIGHIEVTRSAGRSVVSRAYATSPLRLLTPRNHGDAAWIYTASYGGGLLGGDRVAMSVRVEGGARAFLSDAGLHEDLSLGPAGSPRAVRDHRPVRRSWSCWPDPVVCFAGSSYRQRQQFDVDGSGGLVLVDWMTSGRRGSASAGGSTRYDSRLTIRVDGRLVLLRRPGARRRRRRSARRGWGDSTSSAPRRSSARRCAARSMKYLRGSRRSHSNAAPTCSCRWRPSPTWAASFASPADPCRTSARVLRHNLAFVPALLGDDPWARKW